MNELKSRLEHFGGVLSLEEPPVLVHVDRDFMRRLGYQHSPLWDGPESSQISAPLEVHFSVTNACSQNCGHCYMDSGERESGELSAAEFRRAVDLLAAMGVFHMALGGGEALEREDFFELASYVRSRGIVPNLTTNGQRITKETAEKCRIFGQVNVSIDDPQLLPESRREAGPLSELVRAVDLLLAAGNRVGLNCVVSRANFQHLPAFFAFAAGRGLTDLEFLRLKPAGRGRVDYLSRRLNSPQNRVFYPMIRDLSLEYGVAAKIDCSFLPMFCWHRPDKAVMEQFSVYGCEAGNVLLGVRSDGRFAGCSFLQGEESVLELPRLWSESGELARLRQWSEQAPEPCRSCDYLAICKGGCRAVSLHVAGDFHAPDPECPFVEASLAVKGGAA